jgi:phosphopantothenoylcysteine decarboxylase/phosphopantothenate--cysteine ligase
VHAVDRSGDLHDTGDMATFVVTAGPTHEHLDDVRYLANGSSGRMGYAIAAAIVAAGHRCVLVSGPVALPCPEGVERVSVVSAREMLAEVERHAPTADVVIGVAAVCDWRPAQRVDGKPPKAEVARTIELVPNPDVLATVGKAAREGQVIVGFGLEAAVDKADLLARGRRKLEAKHLDMIVLNGLEAMGGASSSATILFADGRVEDLPADSPKERTAARIVAAALQRLEQPGRTGRNGDGA